jgi:hypothetical protein
MGRKVFNATIIKELDDLAQQRIVGLSGMGESAGDARRPWQFRP